MIHTQTTDPHDPVSHYAYCDCGVTGPARARFEDAQADDQVHTEVCTLRAFTEQLDAAVRA